MTTNQMPVVFPDLPTKPAVGPEIERTVIELYNKSQDYRDLLEATSNKDAVEGSIKLDDTVAAVMVRDFAIANNRELAAKAKIAQIKFYQGHVLRRVKLSRKQRLLLANTSAPTADAAE